MATAVCKKTIPPHSNIYTDHLSHGHSADGVVGHRLNSGLKPLMAEENNRNSCPVITTYENRPDGTDAIDAKGFNSFANESYGINGDQSQKTTTAAMTQEQKASSSQSDVTDDTFPSSENDVDNSCEGYMEPMELSVRSDGGQPLNLPKPHRKVSAGTQESVYVEGDDDSYLSSNSPQTPKRQLYIKPSEESSSPMAHQYLTPSESFDFDFRGVQPVSRRNGSSEIGLREFRNAEKGRNRGNTTSDSGAEDCESCRANTSPPMSPAVFSFKPRMFTHPEQEYEDIDFYRKEHERKKSSRRKREQPPIPKQTSNNHRPLPKVTLSDMPCSESTDSGCRTIGTAGSIRSDLRSMHHSVSSQPECHPSTLPHTYTSLNVANGYRQKETPKKGDNSRSCCWLIIFLIINVLISAAALGISLYVLFGKDDEKVVYQSTPVVKNATPTTTTTTTAAATVSSTTQGVHIFEQLQQEIQALKTENSAMKVLIQEQSQNFSSMIQPVENRVEILTAQQLNLSREANVDRDGLQQQISKISLTPGPQGPAGVADFSLCKLKSSTSTAVANVKYTVKTNYVPSDVQTNFALFAFCKFKGALEAVFLHRDDHGFAQQYQCECKGVVSDQKFTICDIYYVECPLISPSASFSTTTAVP